MKKWAGLNIIYLMALVFYTGTAYGTAGDRIAKKCFTLYLGADQECPFNCCRLCCGSQKKAPNIRTVARFTIQRPIDPVMWYAGIPYYYGHTDRYHYCRYCHDVNFYYSCCCCVLIIERIQPRCGADFRETAQVELTKDRSLSYPSSYRYKE